MIEEITKPERTTGSQENLDFKKCECGFLNSKTAKFCASCGLEIKEQVFCETKEQTIRFCNQCGNILSECDAFCNKCGNKIFKDFEIEDNGKNNGDYDVKYLLNGENIIKARLGIIVLSIISIICFFMTFVTESAMGFGISMNGFETAFGVIFGSGADAMIDSEDLAMNIFVFLSIFCCVFALFNVFQKGTMRTVVGMNIVSAVCLLLYMVTYSLYYGYDEWSALVSIEHGFAVWAVIIINVVVAVLGWSLAAKESKCTDSVDRNEQGILEEREAK